MSDTNKQLKLTPPEIIQVWNALFDLEVINDSLPASVRGFIQRFRVYASSEVEAWNEMDEPTRIAISQEMVIFPVSAPVEAHMKQVQTNPVLARELQPAFDYKLPEKKSRFAELAEKVKSQNNDKKQIAEEN